MTTDEIQAEAHRRAMTLPGLTVASRKSAVTRIEAELKAEVAAQAAAAAQAQVQAEATQERQRIAAVVKAGEAMGRARQAIRLALAGPVSFAEARSVLSTLPPDASAQPESLALATDPGAHGTAAAIAERRRICAILSHVEAEGRFHTAAALALETGLDLGGAVAALAGVPRQAPRGSRPTLAQRSRDAGDFGADSGADAYPMKVERSRSIWKKAVGDVNRTIGAAPSATSTEADETARSADLRARLDAAMAAEAEAAADLLGRMGGRIE